MTTYLTIDSSIAYKLITPHTNQQKFIALMSQWQRAGYQLCAPALWLYEVTSIFTKMVHFGELSEQKAKKGIRLANDIGIQLIAPDQDQTLKAYEWTRRLRRIAAYDSFYLALAEELECDLWTTDKRLVNASAQPWVKLVEY
jgi:predicted nucleic acid-binding protein